MPKFPSAAVVTGAVLLGQQPHRVSSRRCRLTYGVRGCRVWSAEDAHSVSVNGYPSQFWHEEDRGYYASGVFDQFMARGQSVAYNEVVVHEFWPLTSKAAVAGFNLYATDQPAGRYIAEPGMRKMAEVTVKLPPGWSSTVKQRSEYKLQAELRFGHTEITMVARDLQTSNAVATSVSWMADAELGAGDQQQAAASA